MNIDEFSQELERITNQLQQLKNEYPELWEEANTISLECSDCTLQDALSALRSATRG